MAKDEFTARKDEEIDTTGYLVTTPNKNFNGTTAGVRFTNGKKLLFGKDSEKTARMLEADFGYKFEFVPNVFTRQRELDAEEIGGMSVAEAVVKPQVS